MDLSLAFAVVEWVLQIDQACVVCQWDPQTQSWVPFAGGAGAAAGAYRSVSDFINEGFDDQRTGVGGGTGSSGQAPPNETPPEDGTYNGPLDPHDWQDLSPEERGVAWEREQERLRDIYRQHHPNDTTAPPEQPSMTEEGVHLFNRSLRTIGQR